MSGLDFGCAGGVCIIEAESGLKCWNWQLWRHIIAIQSRIAAGKFGKNL